MELVHRLSSLRQRVFSPAATLRWGILQKAHTAFHRKPKTENRKPSFWFGVLLCLLILVGSFYNLANYPTIWWDEAIFSETAANLVQHGRYAFTVQSPSQLSDLDFRISVGPAIILPVALAYKLLGVGVAHGRVVAGAYLVLASLAAISYVTLGGFLRANLLETTLYRLRRDGRDEVLQLEATLAAMQALVEAGHE